MCKWAFFWNTRTAVYGNRAKVWRVLARTTVRRSSTIVHFPLAWPRLRAACCILCTVVAGVFARPIGLTSATRHATEQPTTEISRTGGWRSDLDVLVHEVQRQHYVYRRAALPRAFVTGVDRLKARIGEFSDERVLAEANRLMVLLGDGHTYVLPAAATKVPGRWLPLHLYWFPDGLYVIDATDEYADLVGQRSNGSVHWRRLEPSRMWRRSCRRTTRWVCDGWGPSLCAFSASSMRWEQARAITSGS